MGNEDSLFYDGSPLELATGQSYTLILSAVEARFQHFLDATVRNGSTYLMGHEPWEFDGSRWKTTQNQYGCVGLASTFLNYWYNYNEDHLCAWDYVGRGIQYAFEETLAKHEMTWSTWSRRRQKWISHTGPIRGYREFIRGPSCLRFFGQRTVRPVSLAGTVAWFINQGFLLLKGQVSRSSGSVKYRFGWNPEIFAPFAIAGIQGHHVIIYVKRGRGGKDDPPSDGNRPHLICRLAADGDTGTPTTWDEEELGLVPCDKGTHRHEMPMFDPGRITSVGLHPDPHRNAPAAAQELTGRCLSMESELDTPKKDPSQQAGCLAEIAIWNLVDLRPDGTAPEVECRDPLLENRPALITIVQGSAPGSLAEPEITAFKIFINGADDPSCSEIAASDRVTAEVDTQGVHDEALVDISVMLDDATVFSSGVTFLSEGSAEFDLPLSCDPALDGRRVYFVVRLFGGQLTAVSREFTYRYDS